MSEIGARLAGCEIPTNHELSYSFDIHSAILDTYLGRVPELRYTRRRWVGDLLLPPPGAGRVVAVTLLEKLLRLPGVLGGRVLLVPGTEVTPQRASPTPYPYSRQGHR